MIQVDPTPAKLLMRKLRKLENASQKTHQRTMTDARRRLLTFLNKDIRTEYQIKAAQVRPRIKANYLDNETVKILATSDKIPVEQFGKATQIKKGVKVTIRKGQRKLIRSAFILNLYGEKVFKRSSKAKTAAGRGKPRKANQKGWVKKGRLPIQRQFGPSAANMVSQPERLARAEEFLENRMEEQLTKGMEKAFSSG